MVDDARAYWSGAGDWQFLNILPQQATSSGSIPYGILFAAKDFTQDPGLEDTLLAVCMPPELDEQGYIERVVVWFNTNYIFDQATGEFQLTENWQMWAVATHELGHAIGFKDHSCYDKGTYTMMWYHEDKWWPDIWPRFDPDDDYVHCKYDWAYLGYNCENDPVYCCDPTEACGDWTEDVYTFTECYTQEDTDYALDRIYLTHNDDMCRQVDVWVKDCDGVMHWLGSQYVCPGETHWWDNEQCRRVQEVHVTYECELNDFPYEISFEGAYCPLYLRDHIDVGGVWVTDVTVTVENFSDVAVDVFVRLGFWGEPVDIKYKTIPAGEWREFYWTGPEAYLEYVKVYTELEGLALTDCSSDGECPSVCESPSGWQGWDHGVYIFLSEESYYYDDPDFMCYEEPCGSKPKDC
jgi:hypothetical protein